MIKAVKRKFRDHEEKLIQDLQDPEKALAYFNATLMDEDQEVFLLTLKHVFKAQGIEKSVDNLRWHDFRSIIDAMGLQLSIEAKHK
jgi:DNA-binding phage protein